MKPPAPYLRKVSVLKQRPDHTTDVSHSVLPVDHAPLLPRYPLGVIQLDPSSNRRHGEGSAATVEAFIAGVTTAAALVAILWLVREVLA